MAPSKKTTRKAQSKALSKARSNLSKAATSSGKSSSRATRQQGNVRNRVQEPCDQQDRRVSSHSHPSRIAQEAPEMETSIPDPNDIAEKIIAGYSETGILAIQAALNNRNRPQDPESEHIGNTSARAATGPPSIHNTDRSATNRRPGGAEGEDLRVLLNRRARNNQGARREGRRDENEVSRNSAPSRISTRNRHPRNVDESEDETGHDARGDTPNQSRRRGRRDERSVSIERRDYDNYRGRRYERSRSRSPRRHRRSPTSEAERIKEQVRIHEAALELERSKLESLTVARDILKYGRNMDPLVKKVRTAVLPIGRNPPASKETYDGNSCPVDHRIRFEASLSGHAVPDDVKAQLFPHTFYGAAMRWWKQQRPDSISSWEHLITKFTMKFEGFLEVARPLSYLAEITQMEFENLRAFLKRFESVVALVEQHTLKERIMYLGENTHNLEFRHKLIDSEVKTEHELTALIQKFLSTHETLGKMEMKAERKKPKATQNLPPQRESYQKERRKQNKMDRRGRVSNRSRSPRRIYQHDLSAPKEQILEVMQINKYPFEWPAKHRENQYTRNSTEFCAFHKQAGHSTGKCVQLKREIERLIEMGYLKEYIIKRTEVRKHHDPAEYNSGPLALWERLHDPKQTQYAPRNRRNSPPRRADHRQERGNQRQAERRRTISPRRDPQRDQGRDSPRRNRSLENRTNPPRNQEDGRIGYVDQQNEYTMRNPPIYDRILTIAGGPSGGDSRKAREATAEYIREVEEKPSSRVPTGTNLITFDEAEAPPPCRNTGSSHDNDVPLVIEMVIAKHPVTKILVDTGASSNILFMSTVRKMKMSLRDMMPLNTDLTGVGNYKLDSRGIVFLEVSLGVEPRRVTHEIPFVVIEEASHYNIIMGRPALNKFRAVASTFHLNIKFPTPKGIGTVNGNRKQGWECYTLSIRRASRPDITEREVRQEEADKRRKRQCLAIEGRTRRPRSKRPIAQGINWLKMGKDKPKRSVMMQEGADSVAEYKVIPDRPNLGSPTENFLRENRISPPRGNQRNLGHGRIPRKGSQDWDRDG